MRGRAELSDATQAESTYEQDGRPLLNDQNVAPFFSENYGES